MFLISAALMFAMQTAPDPVVIHVTDGEKGCEFRVEGRLLTPDQLERAARGWVAEGREGQVRGDASLSYRCAGGVMFTLQKAGMPRVGFIGDPLGSGVLVSARGPGCTPMINGAPVTIDVLRAEAKRWARDEARIYYQAEKGVDPGCDDSVTTILFESHGIQLVTTVDAGDIMQ